MHTSHDDLNKEVYKIQVSDIRQFDEEVSRIPGMLKLTLGEPDFNTPEHVKEAAKRAIDQNQTHYTGMAGLLELREAASEYMAKKYDVHYQAEDEILVTVGATEAIATAISTLFNPGDAVLLPSPIYSGYLPLIILNKLKPIFIDTSVNDFILTPKMIDEAIQKNQNENIRGIVLNYPSNPTGVTYHQPEVEAMAKTLRRHGLWIISDEIYSELTYGATHFSIAKLLPEQTILINGLSKSHAMTGWRLGFLFAPAPITNELKKVHQYYVTAATTISQYAAVEALTKGINDAQTMKTEYLKRRDFVYDKMTNLGFKIARPDGAFYIFAKIPTGFMQNSDAFTRDLAICDKLAIIPGTAFGQEGEGYVRVSYAADMDKLEDAMKRLTHYIESHTP